MKSILLPTYFPSLSFWKIILKNNFFWMKNSYYKKQTLRNRMFIHGANGKLMLSIPIRHSGINQKRFYDDVSIDSSSDWKKNHFKSIKIAYQSSPYFEFYEEDLKNFYQVETSNLYNFNLKSVELVLKWLEMDTKNRTIDFNIEIYKQSKNIKEIDNREIKKKTNIKYIQTFEDKNGFIDGLSILDMIFNCGPKTKDYIKAGL
tara:strand:+ start:2313 stop:2921 length:609 start_codon:yes stop_codon:yes gene_type:complete